VPGKFGLDFAAKWDQASKARAQRWAASQEEWLRAVTNFAGVCWVWRA
jgi:hypothetical protein